MTTHSKVATTAPDLIELPINALVYRTTRTVENPLGDGRHNRAEWRPDFDKNKIRAGTLIAIDPEGNLYELSRAVRVIPATRAQILRDHLLAAVTAPLEEVQEEVTTESVAESLGGANAVLEKLAEALGGPDKLRALLAGVEARPQPTASTAVVRRASPTIPPG